MSALDTNLLSDSSMEVVPGSLLIAVDVEKGARAVPCCPQEVSEQTQGSSGMR